MTTVSPNERIHAIYQSVRNAVDGYLKFIDVAEDAEDALVEDLLMEEIADRLDAGGEDKAIADELTREFIIVESGLFLSRAVRPMFGSGSKGLARAEAYFFGDRRHYDACLAYPDFVRTDSAMSEDERELWAEARSHEPSPARTDKLLFNLVTLGIPKLVKWVRKKSYPTFESIAGGAFFRQVMRLMYCARTGTYPAPQADSTERDEEEACSN